MSLTTAAGAQVLPRLRGAGTRATARSKDSERPSDRAPHELPELSVMNAFFCL